MRSRAFPSSEARVLLSGLAFPEGGEILQTIALDRGGFACMLGGADRRTLFNAAAHWRGPETMFDRARTGQLLTASAPAPGVGWP